MHQSLANTQSVFI